MCGLDFLKAIVEPACRDSEIVDHPRDQIGMLPDQNGKPLACPENESAFRPELLLTESFLEFGFVDAVLGPVCGRLRRLLPRGRLGQSGRPADECRHRDDRPAQTSARRLTRLNVLEYTRLKPPSWLERACDCAHAECSALVALCASPCGMLLKCIQHSHDLRQTLEDRALPEPERAGRRRVA